MILRNIRPHYIWCSIYSQLDSQSSLRHFIKPALQEVLTQTKDFFKDKKEKENRQLPPQIDLSLLTNRLFTSTDT